MQVSDKPCHRVNSRCHVALLSMFLMPSKWHARQTVVQSAGVSPDWPDIILAAILTAVLMGTPLLVLLFP